VTTYALVGSRRYRPYSRTKRDERTVFFPRHLPNSFGSAQMICSQDSFAGESFALRYFQKLNRGKSPQTQTRMLTPAGSDIAAPVQCVASGDRGIDSGCARAASCFPVLRMIASCQAPRRSAAQSAPAIVLLCAFRSLDPSAEPIQLGRDDGKGDAGSHADSRAATPPGSAARISILDAIH
jgi:hypothetical protein